MLDRSLLLQKFKEAYGIEATEEEIDTLWDLILDNCEYSGIDPKLNEQGREFIRDIIITQKFLEKVKLNLKEALWKEGKPPLLLH